jgi:hypothetical protein
MLSVSDGLLGIHDDFWTALVGIRILLTLPPLLSTKMTRDRLAQLRGQEFCISDFPTMPSLDDLKAGQDAKRCGITSHSFIYISLSTRYPYSHPRSACSVALERIPRAFYGLCLFFFGWRLGSVHYDAYFLWFLILEAVKQL